MKKNYKKVQVLAKNAPTGSYAAGCPEHTRQADGSVKYPLFGDPSKGWGWDHNIHTKCSRCEITN